MGGCPQELSEAAQRSQELADFNAVLAGHANHHQKVMYMKKIQTDYNSIKEVGLKKELGLPLKELGLKELANFNAVLAGHANHHQKAMCMKKIQTDYNTIKEVGLKEVGLGLKELADFNAVLAGHANHHQKAMYMKKIQTDYNTIKEVGLKKELGLPLKELGLKELANFNAVLAYRRTTTP